MILVALGSNRAGPWGGPKAVLQRALTELEAFPAMSVLRHSGFYETAGVGPGRVSVFVNAVAELHCHCGPETLLRRLKMVEREAGPRAGRRWGPRILDLDILDYRGRVLGWSRPHPRNESALRGQLVLPHPLMHVRPFVLAPLVDVAPGWRHPVLHVTAREMWRRMRHKREGRVLNTV